MDRVAIKTRAKEIAISNIWPIWKPILIISLIEGVLGALVSLIFGAEGIFASLFSLIITIALMPALTGTNKYILDIVRGDTPTLDSLTDYYNKIITIILVTLVTGLLVGLGMIFLVVPGLILALCYSMAQFIFVDNPDMPFDTYLKRSRKMMDGYKLDFFVFALSFIGWILLCLLVVPVIFVVPYWAVAEAMYYDELQKKYNEK